MNISIFATEDFKELLLHHEGNFSIIDEKIVQDNSSYNAFFTKEKFQNTILSIVISVFSPFITQAIQDYVKEYKKPIIVVLDEDSYEIDSKNAEKIIPIINQEIEAIISDEKRINIENHE